MSWHLISIWSAVSFACLMFRVAACNFSCDWINSSCAAKILLDAVTTVFCMCWFKWCQNRWFRSTAKGNGKETVLWEDQITSLYWYGIYLAFFAVRTFLQMVHGVHAEVMAYTLRLLLEPSQAVHWRRPRFRRQIRALRHRKWLILWHSETNNIFNNLSKSLTPLTVTFVFAWVFASLSESDSMASPWTTVCEKDMIKLKL